MSANEDERSRYSSFTLILTDNNKIKFYGSRFKNKKDYASFKGSLNEA